MQAIVRKISLFLVIITVMSLFMLGNVYASSEEKQDLKILVIEINPILNSITNKELYPNNDGHPKVSEFFGQDTNKAIDEMKEDLEFASHGYLNIIMNYEYLNEFPTYKGYIQNTNLKRFTEELYLSLCTSSSNPDTGVWYDLITNKAFSMVPAYSFDYEYLIEKFDLVNRRNAGEFDQVWINSIDPVQTFETMMVGKAPYWINGTPLKKDCNNFIIANISISRRDANLHALGHGVEGIMSQAFNGTTFSYNKTFDDSTEEKFKALNLWEQFSMTSSESSGNNSGIGNVHWPYNAEKDYDYTNTKKVYSYWKNWLNYPNLSGEKVLSDKSAWIEWEGNTSLGADQNKDPDRLYMRLWFYLFPHISGVTEDGHLNNWWKYFITLDYADTVKCKFDNKKYTNVAKEFSDTFFSVEYSSGAQKDIPLQANFAKILIQDTNVLKLNENGKLEVVSTGTTLLTCYVDGKFAQYTVDVSGMAGNYDVSFEKIKILSKIEIVKNTLLQHKAYNNIETIINAEKPQLNFIVTYLDGETEEMSVLSDKIKVSIADESVCSVNKDGKLELHKLGYTKITCSIGDISNEYTIIVQTTKCMLGYTESIKNPKEIPAGMYADINGKLNNIPTPIPLDDNKTFIGWLVEGKIKVEDYVFTENTISVVAQFETGHTLTKTDAVTATCIKDGAKAYWTCSNCGQIFSDEAGKIKITEADIIEKASHSLKEIAGTPATCEEDGTKAYWKCSECGQKFSDEAGTIEITEIEIIKKTSHSLKKIVGMPATCEEDGTKTYWKCNNCGEKFSDAAGTIKITEMEIIEKASHKLEKIEGEEATCTKEGTKTYWHCKYCGNEFEDEAGTVEITEIEKIAKLPHQLKKVEGKPATTTEKGIEEHYKCTVCKKLFSDSQGENEISRLSVIIPKKSSGGSGGGSSTSSYKITTKIENGTITPANMTIKKNSDQEFIFKVNDGYEIVDVLLDGKSIGAVESYKLENVTAKHTIEVKTQKITALAKVDDWAKEEMAKAEKMGLIPETFVSKDATTAITRADFAAVAVKLYEALTGKKAEKASNNPFVDTDNEYVLKAYNLGITIGISETKFGDGTITREQMATMIARSLSKAGIDTTVDLEAATKFVDDSEMHDWSRNSIYFMANKEIIKGIGENKFSTLGLAKVEESIAIAVRCAETFKK